MTVQRARMLEILRELKTRGVFTIVGGPWVTVQEDYFEGLADAIFIGEAETTWPQFLEEWAEGRHQYRYEQARGDRHDYRAGPALRPAEDQGLFVRQCPVQPRLSVPMRVLRHHRHVRSSAEAEDERAGDRRVGSDAQAAPENGLHRRRQPDRQQDRGEGVAARPCRVADRRGIPLHVLHRGVAQPRRRRRADRVDGRGQHRDRLHRHREPERRIAARDEEVSKRQKDRTRSSTASAKCRTPASKSGAA